MASINSLLADMRKAGSFQDVKSKGDLGEEAVLAICYDRMKKTGSGLLYQSFMYPYQSNRAGVCYTGNVVYDTGTQTFKEYTDTSINDEIDVLYVTPYRVFAIEVKSYHARKLGVYDPWFNRENQPVEKSPVAQAEKHARHLYHAIYDVLPDGRPEYIVPMVCLVDRCKVIDERPDDQRDYIPVCILNSLLATLNDYNVPLDYNLSIQHVESKLKEISVSIKKAL